jgi:general secretion pathway protein G
MMNRNTKGVTLIELIFAVTLLALLASAILPFARMTAKRTKEIELRRNLRTIRLAIDDYKKAYDKAVEQKKIVVTLQASGYPKTLELLVEGEDFGGLYGTKRKFLRRIPPDPMNPSQPGQPPQWGMRSYIDKPDATSWGKEDVFDVYSLSDEVAIDGSNYKDW